jgi:DNA-binding NtrC family response regulator
MDSEKSQRTILLAESEMAVRDVLADVLRGGGFVVVILSGGWEMFTLPDDADPPSLLVTDINLGPVLDGPKLAAAAQARWFGLPVMCIAGPPIRYQALDDQSWDWFGMTPFEPGYFLTSVQTLLSGRMAQ